MIERLSQSNPAMTARLLEAHRLYREAHATFHRFLAEAQTVAFDDHEEYIVSATQGSAELAITVQTLIERARAIVVEIADHLEHDVATPGQVQVMTAVIIGAASANQIGALLGRDVSADLEAMESRGLVETSEPPLLN